MEGDGTPARPRNPVEARVALGLIAAGGLTRVVALVLSLGKPLEPDSSEYLLLARRYSFLEPWSSSYREPLWRAIVKVATGPFGYSPDAFRVFTTLVSIAALPAAWLAFRHLCRRFGLPGRVALISLGVVAVSPQLIRGAPRGIREDLCLLLFLGAAVPLLAGNRGRKAALGVALVVSLLSVIRFELATLLLGISVLFALARRISWAAPAVALVGLIRLSGPWLVANQVRHGKLLWNSEVHSTFYWKLEQPADVVASYRTPPGTDPKVALSWQQYYLDYLGPVESLRRAAAGYPRLAAKLVASQIVPRGTAMDALGADQESRGWLAALGVIVAVAGAGLAVAVRRIWRRREAVPLLAGAIVLMVVSIAPYAALATMVELRVVMFTVPLLALVAGCAADACLPARVRRSSRRPAVQSA